MTKYNIETEAVRFSKDHADKGSFNVPIYQNSTFEQFVPGQWEEFTYSRTNNPTEDALRKTIAALEQAQFGVIYSSGLAAIGGVMELLNLGDHVVSMADIYGGTFRYYGQIAEKRGVEFSFVNTTNIEDVEKAIKPSTRMIFVETPSNPQLQLTDLSALSELINGRDILLVVDNTMATPVFQNPLVLGADVVLHSTSKYISGHTNVVGGAIAVNSEELYNRLKFLRKSTGTNPGPFDCYLTMLGIKTLPLRMKQHQANAVAMAKYLEESDLADNVLYAGLQSHPQHELAKSQMSGFGGIVSFELLDEKHIDAFVERLQLFSLAVSFGSVVSLIDCPAKMSHKDIPAQQRTEHGVSNSLVRLSLGIENAEDLIEDVEQALTNL